MVRELLKHHHCFIILVLLWSDFSLHMHPVPSEFTNICQTSGREGGCWKKAEGS